MHLTYEPLDATFFLDRSLAPYLTPILALIAGTPGLCDAKLIGVAISESLATAVESHKTRLSSNPQVDASKYAEIPIFVWILDQFRRYLVRPEHRALYISVVKSVRDDFADRIVFSAESRGRGVSRYGGRFLRAVYLPRRQSLRCLSDT